MIRSIRSSLYIFPHCHWHETVQSAFAVIHCNVPRSAASGRHFNITTTVCPQQQPSSPPPTPKCINFYIFNAKKRTFPETAAAIDCALSLQKRAIGGIWSSFISSATASRSKQIFTGRDLEGAAAAKTVRKDAAETGAVHQRDDKAQIPIVDQEHELPQCKDPRFQKVTVRDAVPQHERRAL